MRPRLRSHPSCKQHHYPGCCETGTSRSTIIVLDQRYTRNGFELRVQVVRSYSFYSVIRKVINTYDAIAVNAVHS